MAPEFASAAPREAHGLGDEQFGVPNGAHGNGGERGRIGVGESWARCGPDEDGAGDVEGVGRDEQVSRGLHAVRMAPDPERAVNRVSQIRPSVPQKRPGGGLLASAWWSHQLHGALRLNSGSLTTT